jgi:integrase
MASFLYGSGLRLLECLRLRITDINFSAKHITVRNGKGAKYRVTILPETIIPELSQHLVRVKALHDDFLQRGYGEGELPYALVRKYPNMGHEWAWQYVFPVKNISTDPHTGANVHNTVVCGLVANQSI